ncbi:MAG: hypothetical protein V4492_00710 [Chlamydiota bacterium]
MLADMTFKGVAMMQVSMYAKFNDLTKDSSAIVRVPLAAGLCVTDVVIDTLKYPVVAIEHIFFAAINALGAACFKACRLSDARHSFYEGMFALFLGTPLMALLSIPKLLGQLCKTLPNHSKPAQCCNEDAEMEAKLAWIITDDRQCRMSRNYGMRFPKELAHI